MASCENSWAGRVVIGLQLMSWCAVGALLLHRGISSVKQEVVIPSTPTYNNVQTNLTAHIPTNNSQFQESTSVIHREAKVVETSPLMDKQVPPKLKVSANTLDKQEHNSTKLLDQTDENKPYTVSSSETSTENKGKITESFEKPVPSSKTTPTVTHNVRVPPSLRKNFILTPSGVVMAALGAIMLILGPSIVILRCCDAGSRGRFSKLSADDQALALSALDRPPTYEEVADNAPRYSALFPDDVEIVAVTNAT